MTREQRKLDHIKYALALGDSKVTTGLEDISFVPDCLTNVNPDQVRMETRVASVALSKPLFIDAITGGAEAVTAINKKLAQVAAQTGLAMAVGSQFGTVRHKLAPESYTVIREVNPDGVVFANVSALASPEEVKAAVDMLGAAAVEIHLNVAQELLMPEGDRNFALLPANLQRLQDKVTVPVIIKETGCGMSAEALQKLIDLGFNCFNLAGAGGTSFPAIEAARSGNKRQGRLAVWGLPTAWSLLDAAAVCQRGETIIASGGLRDGYDVAKALALGADAAAMAGNILRQVVDGSPEEAAAYLEEVLADLRDIMVLTGAGTIEDLHRVPLVYQGPVWDFLRSRGYVPKSGLRRAQGQAAGFVPR